MIRLLAVLLFSLMPTAALAAPGLTPGGFSEFSVELPTDLREVAGRGKLSQVTHALVTIAAPANFDIAHDWPVLVVSATSELEYRSSRRLLRAYAETGLASGWILVATDPAQVITFEQDNVPMRLALNTAALSVLGLQWPRADTAPLAFGGFSRGAAYSSWLAAAFASQGRKVIGIYLAGLNREELIDAATMFNVANAEFKRIPVFLQGGKMDEVSPPAMQESIASDLQRARFRNVRLIYVPGRHEVDPGPLRAALDWFRELDALPATGK